MPLRLVFFIGLVFSCWKATIEIDSVELEPPSSLSPSINNDADKYLWLALIDREEVFRERKKGWGEEREK